VFKALDATIKRRRGEALFSALWVRAPFKIVLDCLDDPDTASRVCLMAGSITHEVLAESDVSEYMQQQMLMLAERIAVRLSAEKAAGLSPAEGDPQLVEPVIITCWQDHGEWPGLQRSTSIRATH
jgi:TetR/AcrR family transcriptional regulator, transcriptional repressor for nem operon